VSNEPTRAGDLYLPTLPPLVHGGQSTPFSSRSAGRLWS